MKKNGKYRFSLQFASNSDEHVRVGELLEHLGNRKSQIVVAALNEYMASHPEILNPNCKIEVRITSGYNQTKIEQLIQTIVENKLAAMQLPDKMRKEVENELQEASDEDIEEMLSNLEQFN